MSLSDTINQIDAQLKQEIETTTEQLTLVPTDQGKTEGEEIMRYIQRLRNLSADLIGSYQ